MSQTHRDTKDTEFDGRIQLNGDSAPELEVIVELHDQFVILGHSSGELGRWARNTVHVAPLGRGWFSLDVEDEQVTFLPRRPGHFAAATVDLLPVEEVKKRFGRKDRDKKEKKAKAPAPSRKERRRLRRQEAAEAAAVPVEPTSDSTSPVAQPIVTARDSGPALHPIEPAPTPVESDPVPDLIEPQPTPVEPPPVAIETTPVWVEPAPPPAPVPDVRPPDVPPEPPAEPASPWDDLSVPTVPSRKRRGKKQPRGAGDALPKAAPAKRAKAPKPPRPKPAKPAVERRVVEPVGPPKKSASSRAWAGFRHGLKGMALRISDELRQTGIVPFDRLPAAPARSRPDENHEHAFEEHRLPGGLVRNVCHSCGLVSIGESPPDD